MTPSTNTEAVSDNILQGIAAGDLAASPAETLKIARELLSRRSASNAGGVEVKGPVPVHVRCGYPDCGGECVGCEQGDATRSRATSLAAEAEPVAWRFKYEGKRHWYVDTKHPSSPEVLHTTPVLDIQALYTHPSSPVSAEVTEAWWPEGPFKFGDRVEKPKGSSWHGKVCGWYTTSLTPVGYCVESEREPGSVQLYPVGALASINGGRENG